MREDALSVVVPVYQEAVNLGRLIPALHAALAEVDGIRYEVILVDDGSADNSWAVIQQQHRIDPRVKGVRLSRNFGHQAALTAGYAYATGDAVITMDGDLQHPPELLPRMIECWRDGYDVVSMVRMTVPGQGGFKAASSSLFYRIFNALSDVKIQAGVADFRLLDRRVVRQLNALKEKSRFLRGLISWTGFKELQIPYIPARRFAGQTKYSLRKMTMLAAGAISSFSSTPLRLNFYAGIAVNFVCLGLMGYGVYNKLHENKDLSEWASLFLTMLFLNGLQLLMMGVLGLYVGRIFDEVKGRPAFVTDEELGVTRVRRRRPRRLVATAGHVSR